MIPLRSLLLTGIALAGAALHSNAALFVHDSFDYGTTTNIAGSNGGTGFSGAWTSNPASGGGGDNDFAQIVSPGLSYTDLVVEGNSALTAGDGENYSAHRVLSGTLGNDGTTLWVAVLQAFENGSTNNSGGLFFTSGGTTSGSVNFGLGDVEQSSGNWGIGSGAWDPFNDFTNSDTSNTAITSSTALLLARIDYSASAGSDNAYLWVNPDLSLGEPSIGTQDAALTNQDFETFNGIQLATGSGNNYRLLVDEIRIGSTFNDVAPIPEPSVFGLAALGGVVLLTSRRRRSAR